MAEITGHEPIEDAAVLLETPAAERFKIDGFRGLRRSELKAFARPFFISEDNPNGTIESFKDDLPKEKIIPMLDMYLTQGKFGTDPFNLRPQDKMAAMEKQILELKERWESGTQRKTDPIPHDLLVKDMAQSQAADEKVLGHPLEDLSWDDIRHRATIHGINPWKKTRVVLTSEIEAKEAE